MLVTPYQRLAALSIQTCYIVRVVGTKRARRDSAQPRRPFVEIGQRLRLFRKIHDLLQKDLAILWDTDEKMVGFYEQGRRRLPTDRASALAERYRDLDLNWLLLGRGASPAGQIAQEVEDLKRQVNEVHEVYLAAQGQTAGSRFMPIPVLEQLKREVEGLRAEARRPSTTPASTADELEKLVSLRDKGILTEEEFAGQKRLLLGP